MAAFCGYARWDALRTGVVMFKAFAVRRDEYPTLFHIGVWMYATFAIVFIVVAVAIALGLAPN